MEIKQLYTDCLSEAAYFITSGNEAAVIDPLRDTEIYLQLANEKGVTIKYIFETHFHADFVSGHLDLSHKTGAPIIYGPETQAAFHIHKAKDGEVFRIGDISIVAIHTPGHTLESTCYLLKDASDKPYCIFTGDTLFVGDVGRPDLFSGNLTKEELASMMYDSLNNKIKTLPDHVIVYPAHGPGSACGKSLGKEKQTTIGQQKATNYALKDLSRDEFIKSVTFGLSEPPVYFPVNAMINKKGYDLLENVYEKGLKSLSVNAFKKLAEEGAWIIDTRSSLLFTLGFIPESISIGLDGRFAEWAGSLIPFDQPLIIVTETGKEKETVTRLARVGLDKILGYLEGGVDAWQKAGQQIDMIIDIEPDELAMDIPFDNKLEIIDVRKPAEFEAGHIKGAVNLPLNTLTDILNVAMLDDSNNMYIHCQGGYRSVIAASILKKHGFNNIRNVLGGFSKIKDVKSIKIVSGQTVAS